MTRRDFPKRRKIVEISSKYVENSSIRSYSKFMIKTVGGYRT